MKTKIFLVVIGLGLLTTTLFGQGSKNKKGGSGDENFYFCLGPGISINAPGKNISVDEPTINLEVGFQPSAIKYFNAGMRMGTLRPYSSATRDSSWAYDPGDSLHPPSSHYNHFYQKTATLLFTVGFSGGKESGFTGGVNTGFGVAFVEIRNRLGTFPVWDITAEGGYNVSSKLSFLLNCTYSYLWHSGHMLKEDGFAEILGITCKIKF